MRKVIIMVVTSCPIPIECVVVCNNNNKKKKTITRNISDGTSLNNQNR